MFGEKRMREVIEFDRDEGYLLLQYLIKNGWQVVHEFTDGTILSKYDTEYQENTIAFLDNETEGYEYIAFHSEKYSTEYISYALKKNSLDALFFRTARENTIEWYPVSNVVLIDGTPAYIKHHYAPERLKGGNQRKILEGNPNRRIRELKEKIKSYCEMNQIELENMDISFIARRIANSGIMDEYDEESFIEEMVEHAKDNRVQYADRETTFRAIMRREASDSIYISAKDFKEARAKAEKYFREFGDCYQEETVSIHTLEEWEVIPKSEIKA